MALANLDGYRNAMFPNQLSFDIVVRGLVEEYRQALGKSLEAVREIFMKSIEDNAKFFFETYPALLNR